MNVKKHKQILQQGHLIKIKHFNLKMNISIIILCIDLYNFYLPHSIYILHKFIMAIPFEARI